MESLTGKNVSTLLMRHYDSTLIICVMHRVSLLDERDVLDVEKVILHSGGYILSDVKYILCT